MNARASAGFPPGLGLPEYPWEQLAPYRQKASAVEGGPVDLSIGTPVDPTPEVIQAALAQAADAPGYPTTAGTPALRRAIAGWYARRRGAEHIDPERGAMPTLGSKELVAWLPLLLGLRDRDVAFPRVAYPTYAIGARLAGLHGRALDVADVLAGAPLDDVALLWINSPGNPDGSVLSAGELRELIGRARAAGTVIASDECYAELAWPDAEGVTPEVPSILDDRVTGGDYTGLLSVYSLSKQSNLAGYRAAFVAGDPELVADLTNSRKHAGMIVPRPVQEAMTQALQDEAHVTAQKERYRARRAVLRPAVERAGLRIDHSVAGLYLWCTLGEDAWTTLDRLAERGILAGPGAFYGTGGEQHVRLALTASDTQIATAAARLDAAPLR